MLDLIIFIVSDGIRANKDIFLQTINSIEKTVGNISYQYYFVLNSSQEETLKKHISSGNIKKNKVFKVVKSYNSWAYHFNEFFTKYSNRTNYILISHDDLDIRTKDFFRTTLNLINKKENEIGWITYTSDFYYRDLEKPWSVSVRPGFFKDRDKFPRMFECHKFNKTHDGLFSKNIQLLDMPKDNCLIKSHAPYSDIALIKSSNLKKIGPCVDWTLYTMLIDEDWGLEALRNNLWNIWIPNIYYTHPTNYTIRTKGHRYMKQAHVAFNQKWRFPHGSEMMNYVDKIRKIYKNTLIPWSSYYNSYDWQYL